MNAIDRLHWHFRMAWSKVILWWDIFIHRKTDDDLIAEFESATESISQEEKDKIERLVTERFEKRDPGRPELNPRRTMLFHSRSDEHGCNTVSAPFYRKKILNTIAWAQERGITAFMADYYTPLGLLALETLLELRKDGESFRIYAVRSCYYTQRRTYRAVPETGAEMAFLPSRADYSYCDSLEDMLTEILPSAWTVCTEKGIWIAKNKIPPYLLEAWES